MLKIRSIILSVATVAVTGLLGGCGFGWTTTYIYDNGDKYVSGDREISDKIETIEIDYLSGDVTLTESDSGIVTIKETSAKELDDLRKVHTWVDGTTLYVKYCASAKKLDINMLDKKLTIGVPKDINLSDLKMDIASGDADVTCSADNIWIHASSGDVKLDQKGNSKFVDMHTSSGHVDLNVESVDKVNVSVSSGKIYVNAGNVKDIESKTSSGSSNYTFAKVPKTSVIKAASGDITVNLPKDADLSADLGTASGDVSYDLAFAKNGDNYVCGSGANQMSVHTSSGDVNVKALGQ